MYLAVTERHSLAAPKRGAQPSGEAFATMINLSGRRRFTSQRLVLYAVLAAGQTPSALAVAKEALQLFSDAHGSLVIGGNGLPGFLSPALHAAYFGPAQGNDQIMAFIALAERVLHAIEAGWRFQIPQLLDELVQSTTPLLVTLNHLTALYEQEARAHAKEMANQLHGALDEIRSISKQAQVVAMNARIVAARAGAAGREFAVVATEMISITTDIETILQTAIVKPG